MQLKSLKVQLTQKRKLTNQVLITTSVEALVTFLNPHNQ